MIAKNIKKKFYRMLNTVLASVLTMLGLSDCDNAFNEVYLYGSPYAKYDVKGTVLNEEGEQLEGMKVTPKEIYTYDNVEGYYGHELQSTSTDGKGQYQATGNWIGFRQGSTLLRIVVEDPQHVYATDSVDVTLKRTNKDKGDWCQGTDVGTADLRLKRKKNNDSNENNEE